MRGVVLRLGLLLAIGLASSSGLTSPVIAGLRAEQSISSRIAGEVLIRELGCAHCHADESQAHPAGPGPDFSLLGRQLRPSYLRSFLSRPHSVKPGTSMPDVLGQYGDSERAEAVDALTHFLLSKRMPPPESLNDSSGASADAGKNLFRTIGCVACHEAKDQTNLGLKASLKGVEEKYTRAGLVSFLLDPLATRPSGRMPDMHLEYSEVEALAAYLLETRLVTPEVVEIDLEFAARGQGLAKALHCYNCHRETHDEDLTLAASLESLRLEEGCLSSSKGAWPNYSLSDSQRHSIRVALRSKTTLSPRDQIEVGMRQFNCVACHERDGYGGVPEDRDVFFETRDVNLGQQGRLPPSLDGVGAKLKPTWIRKILFQGAPARPYMKTRMPRFATQEVEGLMDAMIQTDELPPVPEISFKELNKARGVGRNLAGADGLACLTCHTFKGTQVGAMGAVDLSLMAQRLTRDWFHHYLASPHSFSPQTLMPSFWPGGESPLPEILEGDSAKQMEALWLYTSEGYGLGAPKGLRREPMRLLADGDEAVMLRRSYPGIGKRGIGVGYPGGVNLVFDAQAVRLAMIWSGEFIDPSGVWMSQGHGTARPLSRNPIRFGKGAEIAKMKKVTDPWPVVESRSVDHRFKGYQLDAKRQPTFEYEYGDLEIRDFFEPIVDGTTRGLRRTLRFNGRGTSLDPLTLVSRMDGDWMQITARHFEIEGVLHVHLRSGGEGMIISTATERELRIAIGLDSSGKASGEMILDYFFTTKP